MRHLTEALQGMGHAVSRQLVTELLAAAGYSLQANRKTREGPSHPDRDAQFRYINQQVRRFQATAQPVISVDTKKKELVGDFKNAGRQWRPKGQPEPVRVHDFLIPERGKAIPYGVYDLTRNAGWVSVGIDHDTAPVRGADHPHGGGARWADPAIRAHARCSSRRMAGAAMEHACACGNGNCNGWPIARAWRSPSVTSHPGPASGTRSSIDSSRTSAATGAANPLVSLAVIVNLIGATRTAAGLRVRCELDRGTLSEGAGHPDAQMATLNLAPHRFHGDWNYTIHPRRGRK